MLDIKFIRENKELIKEAAQKKKVNFDVDELLKIDDERREALASFESLRTEQNKINEEMKDPSRREKFFSEEGSSGVDIQKRDSLIAGFKELKEKVSIAEDKVREITKTWQKLMLEVPNVPDMSVPVGESEEDNVESKVWGERPVFSFAPKDHVTLMEEKDLIDLERGTKVAGFRGYFLKGDAVLLQFALWQYFLNGLLSKGFTPLSVPSLVTKNTLFGTGYLPQGEEDLYKTQDEEYLAGTGEVATMSYHSDEVLDLKNLPIKYVAFSPCFRREAGSHGKDVKGLIRVHEFFKLEQVILCEASHEESVKYHEELTKNVEELVQGLGLHYHILTNCTADIGLGQVKKYDIEVWMPSQEKFRETHSASYFHDFQTRRLNIRYKDNEGKLRYAHSLNNTLVATPRMLACVIENYQNEDGSITIPEALRPYMGGKEKIG